MSNDLTAVGSNGSITVTNDAVLIHRRPGALTFLNQGLQGDKTIPFRSITAIQFKEAGKTMTGYIQFSAHGHVEPKRGLFPHVNDENCVLFLRDQQSAFERARAEIDLRMRLSAKSFSGASAADELAKLAALLEKGLLTREEFEDRKRVILGGTSNRTPAPSSMPFSAPLAQPAPVQPNSTPMLQPATNIVDSSLQRRRQWIFVGGAVLVGLVAYLNTDNGSNSRGGPSTSDPTPYRIPEQNQYQPSQPATNRQEVAPPSTQTPPTPRVTRTIQGANLRSSAGMEGAVLRQIPANAVVTVLETSGQWVRVSYEGSTGWVFRSLIQN